MRCLVLTNTPAHVHTYKHAIHRLVELGHDVRVLAREYACTIDLCEYYDLPYERYGSHGTERYTVAKFARELPGQLATIGRQARQFEPDVVFGRGPYAVWAGTVTDAETILVLDSEPGELAHTLSARYADLVLTPSSFRGSLGDAHHAFDGLKECAYLHPETFEPDPDVPEALDVEPDESYAIVRFNAFDAFHDVDQAGLTGDQQRELTRRLADVTTVFVSQEGEGFDPTTVDARSYDLHPGRIHDALAGASLLVAETGTMVTEAALLGTPAIGCGAFGDWEFGEFAALEAADLVVVTETLSETVQAATSLLDDDDATDRWRRRRDAFLADTVNLTDLLVDVAIEPATVPPDDLAVEKAV
jgi:predicted glycosyltransferase